VPINQDMMFTGNLFTLLNPYGLVGGVTTVAIFLLHGANFLALKLEGELRQRVKNAARTIWAESTLLYIGLSIYTYVAGFWARGVVNPGAVPIAALAALLLTGYFINRDMEGWAFVMTGLNIVLTQVTFFAMTFPNVMISSTNPAWSLTIYNASSSQYTLTVMSVVALIFVPIVLAYQGWSYYMFRKRISATKETLVY
jgi:cytochrome d ubiquinol oxidase subunit II